MKKCNQIHIENGEDGFCISFSNSDTEFVARSVEILPAPGQPGSIVWMRDAKLIGGAIDTLLDDPWNLQPFMAFYLDKDGEEIGDELMEHMIGRSEVLLLN